MYDYRQDLIELLQNTGKTEADLKQTIRALTIFIKSQDILSTKANSEITKKLVEKVIETSPEANKNKTDVKIIKKANKPATNYRVQRLLAGAKIIDQVGQQVVYYNEQITRNLSLHDGDNVVLSSKPGDYGDPLYYVERVIPNHQESNIKTFGPAVVKASDNQGKLIVSQDIAGNHLYDVTEVLVAYTITPEEQESMNISEGDVVELAWYKDKADSIKIRWKYPQAEISDLNVPKKKHSDYQEKSTENKAYKPTLNFNLDYKTVGIVIADKGLTNGLKEIIEAHHGIPIIAISENVNRIYGMIKNCNYVVLIKNYVNHEISQGLNDHGVKFAMAHTVGQLEVEKAIYRISHNLPTEDQDNIDYSIFQK